MSYGDLTEGEQAHWNEYTNARSISDWPGFDADQDQRRADSRTWLQERRQYIYDLAEGNIEGETPGWDEANRQERYDFLSDENLNNGAPKHEVRLPCSGSATDTEKVYTEEREVYLAFGSTTDEQKARKQANVDWLVARRKQLWHLMDDEPEGNEANDRQVRYDNLCIATHHGSAYEEWDATHNDWGEPYTDTGEGGGRSACLDWLDRYVGVHESPDGSNTGHEQPSKWQTRVYGDDGVPWCACFAVCSSWDNGVSGSGTAGVWNNTDLAKRGEGIYRGYTTDPAKVHAGDHAFIDDDHTGVIYDRNDGTTVEGNTGASNQWNGGQVAKRDRGFGYWSGFGLVRYDD
jgi:hypothetical protein